MPKLSRILLVVLASGVAFAGTAHDPDLLPEKVYPFYLAGVDWETVSPPASWASSKAHLVFVVGTWCPPCMKPGNFQDLRALYDEFANRGLSVTLLFLEGKNDKLDKFLRNADADLSGFNIGRYRGSIDGMQSAPTAAIYDSTGKLVGQRTGIPREETSGYWVVELEPMIVQVLEGKANPTASSMPPELIVPFAGIDWAANLPEVLSKLTKLDAGDVMIEYGSRPILAKDILFTRDYFDAPNAPLGKYTDPKYSDLLIVGGSPYEDMDYLEIVTSNPIRIADVPFQLKVTMVQTSLFHVDGIDDYVVAPGLAIPYVVQEIYLHASDRITGEEFRRISELFRSKYASLAYPKADESDEFERYAKDIHRRSFWARARYNGDDEPSEVYVKYSAEDALEIRMDEARARIQKRREDDAKAKLQKQRDYANDL